MGAIFLTSGAGHASVQGWNEANRDLPVAAVTRLWITHFGRNEFLPKSQEDIPSLVE